MLSFRSLSTVRRRLLVTMAAALLSPGLVAAEEVRPGPSLPGQWVELGQTQASHDRDHDRIEVKGKHDEFRRLKFKVKDAPLNLRRIVVNYDNGASEQLEVRENIPKGGETRPIDLRGQRRSIRSIEFWYDTQGWLQGKADVKAFGQR